MTGQVLDARSELVRQFHADFLTELAEFRRESASWFAAVERRFQTLEADMLEIKQAIRVATATMLTLKDRLDRVDLRLEKLEQA